MNNLPEDIKYIITDYVGPRTFVNRYLRAVPLADWDTDFISTLAGAAVGLPMEDTPRHSRKRRRLFNSLNDLSRGINSDRHQ